MGLSCRVVGRQPIDGGAKTLPLMNPTWPVAQPSEPKHGVAAPIRATCPEPTP